MLRVHIHRNETLSNDSVTFQVDDYLSPFQQRIQLRGYPAILFLGILCHRSTTFSFLTTKVCKLANEANIEDIDRFHFE